MQEANGPRLELPLGLTMNPLNLDLMRLPSAAHSQTIASARTGFATALNLAGVPAPMAPFDRKRAAQALHKNSEFVSTPT